MIQIHSMSSHGKCSAPWEDIYKDLDHSDTTPGGWKSLVEDDGQGIKESVLARILMENLVDEELESDQSGW